MIFSFVLALCLLSLTSGQETIGCFVEGECTASLFLNDGLTETPQDCLDLCRATTTCTHFTYFENERQCIAFANCNTFAETCQDGAGVCMSGDSSCPDIQCDIQGRCEGNLISYAPADWSGECHDRCEATTECLWWNFNSLDGGCFLLDGCSILDTDCETCTSGQKFCEPEQLKSSCGGDIYLEYSTEISFTSPGYPSDYGTNEFCEWNLYAPSLSDTIKARFTVFELEENTYCNFDWVEIHDGFSDVDPGIGDSKICYPDFSTIYNTTGSELYVNFQSDGSNQFQGFIMSVSVV